MEKKGTFLSRVRQRFIERIMDFHYRFMEWGYNRYINQKDDIEKRIGYIVLSNIVSSAFWLGVSIYADCSFWLFVLMLVHPIYSYFQLTKGGFLWRQPVTVYSFLISCVFYALSFIVQLTKLDITPDLFP